MFYNTKFILWAKIQLLSPSLSVFYSGNMCTLREITFFCKDSETDSVLAFKASM